MTALRVEAAGSVLVQDLGRPGLAHLGVAGSGALDRGALALANRLVGNPDDAAGLEVVLGGFRAVPDADAWVAVAGAWGPMNVGGRPAWPYRAHRVRAGEVLELGTAERGLRYLLAVRGGIDEPPVLGSRSRDTLAGLGPEPVRAGRVLRVGAEPAASVPLLDEDAAYPPPAGPVTLGLLPGPRADWVTDAALAALYESPWRLSASADRIGARLEGPPLARAVVDELPSEPTVAGGIQVTGAGVPTVLLADRPVTGGYPVVAIVEAASLDRLAQVRPGQEVRFRHAR
ncbi:5-oxoprolinase subunit C family protein [Agromyces indicus]|uniref:Biotin-dependent carboxyltransferase family protein n=1 Tax=Agromyces indicus TaxID=758919 RepID=A0ABU1FLF9_9MICO|nr:biotin-dependent carboxyltransferase family protein [Agromyces indicus]MDR5692593.1 biotin-dependent carboxyltransferase family protein [Agromyces indicus]